MSEKRKKKSVSRQKKKQHIEKLIRDSSSITIRNFSNFISEDAVRLEGYDPEKFMLFDFDVIELLLAVMNIKNRKGEKRLRGDDSNFLSESLLDALPEKSRYFHIVITFTLYDILKVMGKSYGIENRRAVERAIEKLKTYRRITVVSDNEVATYDFPVVTLVEKNIKRAKNGREKIEYEIIFSPLATQLLLLDRRVKTTVSDEFIHMLFKMPKNIRKLLLFLINHFEYRMDVKTAARVCGVNRKDVSKFRKTLEKYSKDLVWFGAVYKPSEDIIEYKQQKTVIDFRKDESSIIHTVIRNIVNIIRTFQKNREDAVELPGFD